MKGSSAVRSLWILLAASLVVPALVLAGAAFLAWRASFAEAEQKLVRTLDVLYEHAFKVVETHELVIEQVNALFEGLDDERIRAREAEFRERLAQIPAALPQVLDVWIVDRDGRPLVDARRPVRPDADLSQRDYFTAHSREGGADTFVGDVVMGIVTREYFFTISRRRPAPGGAFNGVTVVSVNPEYFHRFYERVAAAEDYSISLARSDGARLAFYPPMPPGPSRAPPESRYMQEVARAPEFGIYRAPALMDGKQRMVAYRKLPNLPVHVSVGVADATVVGAWKRLVVSHLFFGVPATLALFLITLVAVRHAQRGERSLAQLRAEMERREAAEEGLRQAHRLEALGQLTGGVAHDFNNLLMVVNGNVEILKTKLGSGAPAKEIAAIERAVARGEGLTRHLLSFARRQTLSPKVLRLRDRLVKMREMLQRSLRGNIDVVLDVPETLWPIEVDPGELELAVLNVAVNARDAMPQGGELRVVARNVVLPLDDATAGFSGEFVALSLSDSGGGIPAAVLPKIFEPFYTTKEVGKGTGLGLSQVYGFASQSGGTAAAESEAGSGATVTIYLPRARREEAEETTLVPHRTGAVGRGHVLLVEDNDEVAEVSRTLLQELGYEVRRHSQAASALAAIDDAPWALLFSDIVMPGGMSGLDLARLARSRHPELPILLTTGYSDAAAGSEGGGFPIVTKPFSLAALEKAVAGAVGQRAAGTAEAAGAD